MCRDVLCGTGRGCGDNINIDLTQMARQGRACTGVCGSEYGLVLGFCEHGNEPSCYVICDSSFLFRHC